MELVNTNFYIFVIAGFLLPFVQRLTYAHLGVPCAVFSANTLSGRRIGLVMMQISLKPVHLMRTQ